VIAMVDAVVAADVVDARGRHGGEAAVARIVDDRDDGATGIRCEPFEAAADRSGEVRLQLVDASLELADGVVDVDVELGLLDLARLVGQLAALALEVLDLEQNSSCGCMERPSTEPFLRGDRGTVQESRGLRDAG
jgi:hypothetical protein